MDSTLSFEEFAALAHTSVVNLKRTYARHADQMPPKVVLPGGRKVFFRRVDIEKWLASRVGVKSTCFVPVPPRKRGRPRKIDQVRRADVGPGLGGQP